MGVYWNGYEKYPISAAWIYGQLISKKILAVFEIIYVVHWCTDFIILNKIGWIYIVFLSFWSRIKRVHNNSQRVEFDKWHTFDTFMKLILKKHSIWNVSLIFLELFFKFLSEDSGADELNNQNWCGLQEINIFLGNYRKIFFFG